MTKSQTGTPDDAVPEERPGGSGLPEHDWALLVERIRSGSDEAIEELYRVFSRGVRFFICRQLGSQDLDDKVHECFMVVIQAVQRGEIREPERLMGFVRTVVRRHIAARIEEATANRRRFVDFESGIPVKDVRKTPEQAAIDKQNKELAARVLRAITPRDREILIRFYLDEQPAEEICRDMGLTETQFRLIKSRAKARFGELGRQRLSRRRANRFL